MCKEKKRTLRRRAEASACFVSTAKEARDIKQKLSKTGVTVNAVNEGGTVQRWNERKYVKRVVSSYGYRHKLGE